MSSNPQEAPTTLSWFVYRLWAVDRQYFCLCVKVTMVSVQMETAQAVFLQIFMRTATKSQCHSAATIRNQVHLYDSPASHLNGDYGIIKEIEKMRWISGSHFESCLSTLEQYVFLLCLFPVHVFLMVSGSESERMMF